MKSYEILHNETCYTAVGSCNFTEAGLKGDSGNVEAMLVFEGWFDDLKLKLVKAKQEDLADEEQNEEEVPNPVPIVVVVAYDWQAKKYRWRLDHGCELCDFKLHLPDSIPKNLKSGMGAFSGEPPERGASYEITYWCGSNEKKYVGHIVELNLDSSSRTYGRALSASEILDSWRGRKPPSDQENGDCQSQNKNEKQTDMEESAAFDAVNLYDFYRAVHQRRKHLEESHRAESERRAMLVSRSDSFLALCRLAEDNGEAKVVRFLVLRELFDVITKWRGLVGRDLVSQVQRQVAAARRSTIELLVRQQSIDKKQAGAMLRWFEKHLRQ